MRPILAPTLRSAAVSAAATPLDPMTLGYTGTLAVRTLQRPRRARSMIWRIFGSAAWGSVIEISLDIGHWELIILPAPVRLISGFGLRILDFLRISDFELRIYLSCPPESN